MIDKRINYRYGGDTMGGPNDRSSRGPSGPPGGGATSMGSGRDYSSGGNTARERGITQQFEGPRGTTGSIANIRDTGPDLSKIGAPDRTADVLQKFTSYRPEVNIPPFMIASRMFQPLIQKFSDISAAQNRGFFADPNYQFGIGSLKFGPNKSVIEAGRYQLPGELGEKYGKLGYEDITEMTPEELNQAYKSYLDARLSGDIDAYGNVLFRSDRDDSTQPIPLQPIPLKPIPVASNLGGTENLTGIAKYYDQLLKSFGLKV